MATTTAAITLTSSDLLTNALALSASMTLYQGGTTATGLEEFRMERFKIATGTQFDVIEATTAASEDANYVYLINKNTDPTHYVIISLWDVVVGRLYAGDWMFIPWSQTDESADIEVAATNWTASTGDIPVEYALFHEDTDFLTNA